MLKSQKTLQDPPLVSLFFSSFGGSQPKSLKEPGKVKNVVKEGKGETGREGRHLGPAPKHVPPKWWHFWSRGAQSLSKQGHLRFLQQSFGHTAGEAGDGTPLQGNWLKNFLLS